MGCRERFDMAVLIRQQIVETAWNPVTGQHVELSPQPRCRPALVAICGKAPRLVAPRRPGAPLFQAATNGQASSSVPVMTITTSP